MKQRDIDNHPCNAWLIHMGAELDRRKGDIPSSEFHEGLDDFIASGEFFVHRGLLAIRKLAKYTDKPGPLYAFKRLVENGAHSGLIDQLKDDVQVIGARREWKHTILNLLQYGSYLEPWTFLEGKGADFSAFAPDEPNLALFFAADRVELSAFAVLCDLAELDIDEIPASKGVSVLQSVVKGGNDDMFEMVMSCEPNVDLVGSPEQLTPLEQALHDGRWSMAIALLDAGATVPRVRPEMNYYPDDLRELLVDRYREMEATDVASSVRPRARRVSGPTL